jgi:hypothetical protein
MYYVQYGQHNKDYHCILDTPINSLQMDFEKIVSAIFSNLSLNIDMGKKKLKNKKLYSDLHGTEIVHKSALSQKL